MRFNWNKYRALEAKAISHFWQIRLEQLEKQGARGSQAEGNRGAVTGGKQLDGFLELLEMVAMDAGVPQEYIHTKGNHLPGFFRPTKDWDFIVVTPQNKLLVVIELKSQVGSFGNNFNNRTEEAIGSAVDLWTAFRENAFPNQDAPWVGYLMVAEKAERSTSTVRLSEPHFQVFEEFRGSSYLDRYRILCQKLIAERHYTASSVVWTEKPDLFGDVSKELSMENFLRSLAGYLFGKGGEFGT